jgi:hypothetical protein
MKWYFAINEVGAGGGPGFHARLAVLSAIRAGGLSPHLLYMGARGGFTEWMEAHGVAVIDAGLTFMPAFEEATRAGRHPASFSGHWLRTGICLLEQSEEFVLYTDCDVIFRRAPDLADVRPEFIACAPEFRPDCWEHFNSGVLVMNVPALRRDYRTFEKFIVDSLASTAIGHFDDQVAYNEFYRDRWTRADPALNWKPYWGFNERAIITHYHGPKLDAMRLILDGLSPWDDAHCRMIGSLFIAALPSYIAHLRDLLAILGDSQYEGRDVIERIANDCEGLYRIAPMDRVDLSFMIA